MKKIISSLLTIAIALITTAGLSLSASGDVNIALGKPVYTSSDETSNMNAQGITDGRTDQWGGMFRWSVDGKWQTPPKGAWAVIELKGNYSITRIKMDSGRTEGELDILHTFSFDYFYNGTWGPIENAQATDHNEHEWEYTLDNPVTASRIRVVSGQTEIFRVREIAVFGEYIGEADYNVAFRKPTTVNINNPSSMIEHVGASLTDGTINKTDGTNESEGIIHRWFVDTGQNGANATIDLGTAHEINSFVIHNGYELPNNAENREFLVQFEFQSSLDGITYTPIEGARVVDNILGENKPVYTSAPNYVSIPVLENIPENINIPLMEDMIIRGEGGSIIDQVEGQIGHENGRLGHVYEINLPEPISASYIRLISHQERRFRVREIMAYGTKSTEPTNVAYKKPVVLSADTQREGDDFLEVQKAMTDGKFGDPYGNNRWFVHDSAARRGWAEIDLQGYFEISSLGFYNGNVANTSDSLRNFKFRYDDQGIWKDIPETRTTNLELDADQAGGYRYEFPLTDKVATSKIRLEYLPTQSGNTRLREIMVFGVPTEIEPYIPYYNVARGKSVDISEGGSPTIVLTDGVIVEKTAEHIWSVSEGLVGATAEIDLGQPCIVKGFVVYNGDTPEEANIDGGPGVRKSLTNFEFQYFDDTEWVPIPDSQIDITDLDIEYQYKTEVLLSEGVMAKKIRLISLEGQTNPFWLREIEVYGYVYPTYDFEITEALHDGEGNVTYSITNNRASDLTPMIAVAMYSNDGNKLEKIKISKDITIEKLASESLREVFAPTDIEGVSYKIFIWGRDVEPLNPKSLPAIPLEIEIQKIM